MLKVNEIFYSIQGESTYAGLPCVFIRLTGCNLRCRFCDTTYAYEAGEMMSIPTIERQLQQYDCNLVEITGGEPLLQSETPNLAESLLKAGKTVLVETNGTFDIRVLPSSIIRIMDLKCPDSGESEKTIWQNLEHLSFHDQLKCVVSSRKDFEWAMNVIRKYQLIARTTVLFSPVFDKIHPRHLAEWILDTTQPVRLQLQLHKYIWGPKQRSV